VTPTAGVTPAAHARGRVAVVTGASSGVGRAVALRLAADGVLVVAVGRDEARLASLVKEAEVNEASVTNAVVEQAQPATIVPARCDLTDDDARAELAAEVVRTHGRLHHLVHSAGGYVSSPVEAAHLRDFDAQYAANVRAPYALTQGLLPALRAAGRDGVADVVVVNSSQGVHAGAGASQFAATQHAMRAVADSLRQEVNSDGIRVCSIHLGRTATPRQEAIFAKEGRTYRPELLLQPEDVADVVAGVLSLPATAEITELHLRPAKKSY
jgi:NADP-dependent 3-hydroxy acid dehydrogenase YdfG